MRIWMTRLLPYGFNRYVSFALINTWLPKMPEATPWTINDKIRDAIWCVNRPISFIILNVKLETSGALS